LIEQLIERVHPDDGQVRTRAIRRTLVAACCQNKFEQSGPQTTVAEIASQRGFKKSRPPSKDYRNEFAEIRNSKNESLVTRSSLTQAPYEPECAIA